MIIPRKAEWKLSRDFVTEALSGNVNYQKMLHTKHYDFDPLMAVRKGVTIMNVMIDTPEPRSVTRIFTRALASL